MMTASAFQEIKEYILRKGDRQTYCQMYNNNPHARFGGFDAYLDPATGQRNIDCDPALSDFDELVIQDQTQTGTVYVRFRVEGGHVMVVPERTDPGGMSPAGVGRTPLEYFELMLRAARGR